MDIWEEEENAIDHEYALGHITNEERNKQLRELQRDFCAAAQESAERAYEEEMDRWM